MKVQGARHVLAMAVSGVLIASVLTMGTIARRAVADAARLDLRASVGMAASLYHETRAPALLDGVFPGRWTYLEEVDPLLDGPEVRRSRAGSVARAPVFDEEFWEAEGQIRLTGGTGPDGSWPPLAWAGLLLATGILLWAGRVWLGNPRSSAPLLILVATLLACGIGMSAWARGQLTSITDIRLDQVAGALERLPDPEGVALRPGGLDQLLGVPVLRTDDAGDRVSALGSERQEVLRAGDPDAGGRIEAGGVNYAVRDRDGFRVASLPMEHTHGVGARLSAVILATMLALWLLGVLSHVADARRTFVKNVTAWSFLAPGLLHLAAFTFGPLVLAAWLSLHDWSLLDRARPFIGLENYRSVATDASWWSAIVNTVLFASHVPVAMAAALGLALIVRRSSKAVVALRAIFFLPTITSLVALAIVWQWMFHSEYGVFNAALGWLGLGPVPWLTSPTTALPALMLMSIWMVVGYQMVLFQAGLVAIPEELYDAARIDGAGPFSRFWHVTLPGLRHTLFFVLVTSVIGSFQIFGAVYVMTEGGPLGATDVAVYHIYEEAWEFFRFGRAAAMSWILFAIIFVLTWLQFRGLDRAESTT